MATEETADAPYRQEEGECISCHCLFPWAALIYGECSQCYEIPEI